MGSCLADCQFPTWRANMKSMRFRHAAPPKVCLLVFLIASVVFVAFGSCETSNGDSVEVQKCATLNRVAEPLPFLQKKTLFLIANEPVLESHVVSNLLHQLLYTLQVPNSNVQLLDEVLLSEHGKTSHATLLPWLLNVHRELPAGIEFVWLGTAYSRVVGPSLEKLMALLVSEAQETDSRSREWYPPGLCAGYALKDPVLSRTHHFYQDDAFVYPFLDAGLLMDRKFLRFLDQTVKEEGTKLPPRIEIDPIHELFKFLYQTRGFLMQHSNLFCPSSPISRDFDRAEVLYPPRHKRPTDGATPRAQGNDDASDAGGEYKGGTANGMLGSRRSPALSTAEKKHIRGCVSFGVGCRHSPILSHQFFDRMMEFEHDIMERKEALAEQYPIGADVSDDHPEFREKEEALMKERPVFIAEPEDVLIAVKTHPANHGTRVRLLKKLWAAPDVVVEMAQRRAKASNNAHPFRAAVAEQEHASLEKHMRNIAIEFFTDKTEGGASGPTDIVSLSVTYPGEKRALCEKLRGILKHFYQNHKTRKYLVIVDDDTLVNVRHLLDAISMTLHPPIPARVFFRQALSDENAIRKAHAPYKALAESIDSFLADWKAKRALRPPSAESALPGKHDSSAAPKEGSQQGRANRTQGKHETEAAVTTPAKNAFVSKAYVKNRAAEASRGGGKKHPDVVDRISPLYLGQRYSFGHTHRGDQGNGYDYITMGGGVVLDREAVEEVLECRTCRCPEDGTGDDMILGRWMHQLKIPALHGRWFHQEKPADYHPEHLRMTTPVSFHRLEKETGKTKEIFDKFVDIGDGLNVGAEEVDDFEAVDWIDFDWQQVEDAVWHDHDDGEGDFDDGEDEELSLHSIVQRVVEEGKKQGKHNMSPDDIADHLEKEVKEHEAKEKAQKEDWSWLHDEL
ncbi:UNVERIFIED_CONTAM: hypothetical protein HHA_239752 [Hammondia hammondi]|eukprot:XP_008887756.1 hypothetical protein HHA_239752 [Hammondia hammondi]